MNINKHNREKPKSLPNNNEPPGKAWFGNEYFDSKKKKWKSINSKLTPNRLYLAFVGVIGTFVLYISLLPVALDAKNIYIISNWWHSIWSFGDFGDFLRAAFVIFFGLFFLRGFIGVILSPFKVQSATRYILSGGIAGLVLLIAFWSGVLNGSVKMLFSSALLTGSTVQLSNHLIWTHNPPAMNYPFITYIMSWGWIKISLIGCCIWVVGTLPFTNWWRRLT